jgi:hypothetical protein
MGHPDHCLFSGHFAKLFVAIVEAFDMSVFWGVTCKTCEEFIKIDSQAELAECEVITYIPSAGNFPTPCSCGSSYVYGTSDVVDEDGVFLNPWPE